MDDLAETFTVYPSLSGSIAEAARKLHTRGKFSRIREQTQKGWGPPSMRYGRRPPPLIASGYFAELTSWC